MLKNPEDRRARRSRKLLKESLLELMKRKSFADISVRDITDVADMNRATFYLHYSGTTELLQSVEEDLLSELRSLIDAHMQETVAIGSIAPVFEPVLDFVVEHRETCSILFSGSEASGFFQALQQLVHEKGEPGMARSRKELLAAAQRMAEGSAAGLFSREEGRKPS